MVNLKKRLILDADINFDTAGIGEEVSFFGSDGKAYNGKKINASHLPLTKNTRQKLAATNVDEALKIMSDKLDNVTAGDVLSEDTVIIFGAEDDAETIQNKINQQKKNLNGHTLTFEFPASLSQNLYAAIVFENFYNGSVIISGGSAERKVAIYDQLNIGALLKFYRCQCEVIVKYFQFVHQYSLYGVLCESSSAVIVEKCLFSGIVDVDSYSVAKIASNVFLVDCESTEDIDFYPPEKESNIGKSLGEVFAYPASVPPEGAYLLNGQTIPNCAEAYTKFWTWVNTSGVRIIDNATFEAELAQYGVCDGFVLDSSTGNVRLPKWHWQSPLGETLPVRGNCMTLGLTDGTKNYGVNFATSTLTYRAADYGKPVGQPFGAATVPAGSTGITTDPEKSGIVAETNAPIDHFVWCIRVFNAATDLSEQESSRLASLMQMKAQTDFGNVAENLDFIIKHEEAADGSWWYDLYRNGKVVQGGYTEHATAAGSVTINLPIEMANNNYIPLLTIRGDDGFYTAGGTYSDMTVSNVTTTSFDVYLHTLANTKAKYWRVEGKATAE